MRTIRLIGMFIKASFQEEAAYRANFFLSLLYSCLNLATGVLGIVILFSQVDEVNGWDFADTLALLGVYLVLGALRGLVFGPSLEALVGMDGEVWSGRLDFTLVRPVSTQFLASFRRWRLFSLLDLALGLGVVWAAVNRLNQGLEASQVAGFLLALAAGVSILYAVLLIFSALVFWSPGVLFTWVFDGLFQMARYPLGVYPGWLRLVLTWVIPVGIITTLPASALTGKATPASLVIFLSFSVLMVVLASAVFRYGLRQYKSASS